MLAQNGYANTTVPKYQRVPGVAGKLVSVGSDTMANMMELWADEFESYYPHINIEVDATGSSTAPPALAQGVATIGAMSRPMKASEIRQFERAYGYPPTALRVALDAIAVFVSRRNTVPSLSLQQVDAIFSATRFCGNKSPVTHWSQLGVDFPENDLAIDVFGRNSVSGTYGSFKVMALCGGDFRNSVREQPGSAAVVMSVAANDGAIGYSAYGYKTAGVRAIPIGLNNTDFIALTRENVQDEKYPFSRFLYLVVNKPPNKPLPTLTREFLLFVLSTEGQQVVQRDGYFAIKDALAIRQRRMLLNR